jgi:flagellin-like hook-associated protein FlgL
MRVTELTKHNAVNKNLNTNSEELQELMVGISNGKILNKPSDDPVGAAKVGDFRTSINHSKTLEKNISADKVWLNSNEGTIAQMEETLRHVKDLALEGSNGSSTKENRSTLANEIKIITKNLVDLGNKKEGKLYLFSGTKTFTKPLEISESLNDPVVKFFGTRIKSSEKVVPINQDKPLDGIKPGSFTIYLNETPEYQAEDTISQLNQLADETLKNEVANDDDAAGIAPEHSLEADDLAKEELTSKKIVVFLNGLESLEQIIKKINEAAIEESGFIEDPHSPIGFKAKVSAEIGIDNAIYLDPEKNMNIKFGEDTSGFFSRMKFEIIGAPGAVSAEGDGVMDTTGYSEVQLDPAEFEAFFHGYAKDNYLVRVIKGGSFGAAHVIISDDDGTTWSQPQVLNKVTEVFNPEGKASNKIDLEFKAGGQPFFREGLEFQFKGNEFVKYKGNEQSKEVIVDNGIKVALNINAMQLFKEEPGNDDSVDIFDMLNRLSEALEDDDQTAVMKSVGDIDKSINQVLQIRSRIGSTFNELESSEERIQSNIDFKQEELSKLEDMDLAKGAVDLNMAELRQKTALDASARLIQPTLIDFLR